MTKKENLELAQMLLELYSGILFHHREFAPGNREEIQYTLDCPEFQTLREKYDLEKIAGKGSDFARSRRLMHWMAPRLTHSGWYDNHVDCNALDLLEYSLDNPEQGINCLNKAKILEECCLALGIHARRVYIMPFSPYDFDNHVVTEVYDRGMEKWIMLDPTTDGYFVDEAKTPLSLLEMREKFAADQFVTYVRASDRLGNLEKLRSKYREQNAYICKNLFYFGVDQQCCFGETGDCLWFCPAHYSIRENRIGNARYRMNHMPEEYSDMVEYWQEQLEKLERSGEPERTSIERMRLPPEGERNG